MPEFLFYILALTLQAQKKDASALGRVQWFITFFLSFLTLPNTEKGNRMLLSHADDLLSFVKQCIL